MTATREGLPPTVSPRNVEAAKEALWTFARRSDWDMRTTAEWGWPHRVLIELLQYLRHFQETQFVDPEAGGDAEPGRLAGAEDWEWVLRCAEDHYQEAKRAGGER